MICSPAFLRMSLVGSLFSWASVLLLVLFVDAVDSGGDDEDGIILDSFPSRSLGRPRMDLITITLAIRSSYSCRSHMNRPEECETERADETI
jgi:hypothetical protein